MHKLVSILLLLLLLIGCKQRSKKLQNQRIEKPVIILQPLNTFSYQTLLFLKDSIEQFYPVRVQIAKAKEFPVNCYYKPRNRYRADSTIKWLRQIKPDSIRTIVGITDADISTSKGLYKDFGVMGLGYQPGGSCVISTVRLQKPVTTSLQLRQRLFKVVVHEMGHNFGLSHCPNQTCIMVDAEGKMKLDKEKDFCADCKQKLRI